MSPLPFLLSAVALADPVADADRALLSALLTLLSEETGAEGARALGLLGDPRAVPPLTHAVQTRRAEVGAAAVMALSHYPEALPAMAGWLIDARLAPSVRLATADAVGVMGSPEGADALLAALRTRELSAELRDHYEGVVRARYPARAGELEGLVSRPGTAWLVGGGAIGLGYTLAAAGHFSQSDVMVGVGGFTGAVGGGTGGYVLGRAFPMESGDAAFAASSGVLGIIGGTVLGASIDRDDADAAYLGGLLGEAVGYGLGFGLRERHAGSAVDTWEAVGVSGLTAMAAGTLVRFGQSEPVRVDDEYSYDYALAQRQSDAVRRTVGISVLAGGALGHVVAPRLDTSGKDMGALAVAAAYGTMVGALVPIPENRARRGLAFSGQAVGALTAYGLSNVTEPDWDVIVGGTTGLGYGSLVGLGIGMMATPDAGDTVRGLTLVGGTVGLVSGGALAWRSPGGVHVDDVVLSGASAGWGLFQTAGWLAAADGLDTRANGLLPLVPALAGSATAAASPVLDVDFGQTLAASSLGLWGVYLGVATSEIADIQGGRWWMPVMVGSDVGLGLGVLMESPLIGASPAVVGLADAGGALGGALAALGAAYFTREGDPILIASLGGAAAGAVGGTVAGLALTRDERAKKVGLHHLNLPDLPGQWAVSPASFYDADAAAMGWGMSLEVDRW